MALLFGKDNPYQEAADELDRMISASRHAVLEEYAVGSVSQVSEEIGLLRALLGDYGLSLRLRGGNALLARTTVSMNIGSQTVPLELIDADVYRPGNLLRGEVSDIASAEQGIRQLLDEQRSAIPATFPEVTVSFDRQSSGAVVRIGWGGGRGNAGDIWRDLGIPIGATDFEQPLDLIEVLSAASETASLIASVDGRPVFLPRTKDERVWGQVRSRNPIDAREYLFSLANARENALLVFGLSLPPHHASWVIPLTILGFSLHLFMHVRHIISLISRSNVGEYPWLPLMRVCGAGLFTFVTVIFLPLFTLGAVVYYLESTAEGRVAAVLLGAASTVFIVLSYLGLRCLAFRRLLAPNTVDGG